MTDENTKYLKNLDDGRVLIGGSSKQGEYLDLRVSKDLSVRELRKLRMMLTGVIKNREDEEARCRS